jgi:hypothetical protein
MGLKDWPDEVEVNRFSDLKLIRTVLPVMKKQGYPKGYNFSVVEVVYRGCETVPKDGVPDRRGKV